MQKKTTPSPPATSNVTNSSTNHKSKQLAPNNSLKYLHNVVQNILSSVGSLHPEKYSLVRTFIQDLLADRVDLETFAKKMRLTSMLPILKQAMLEWRFINGNQPATIESFLQKTAQGQSFITITSISKD